jgi:hypothetical protein
MTQGKILDRKIKFVSCLPYSKLRFSIFKFLKCRWNKPVFYLIENIIKFYLKNYEDDA